MKPRRGRGRARGALLAALLAGGCGGDDASSQADLSEVWPIEGTSVYVTQLDNADLVAIDSRDGKVAWRYRHFGLKRHPDVELPRARLVCEPVVAPSGAMYLVFTDYLVAFSPDTDTVSFRFRLRFPLPRSMCPAVTLDGGLAMLVTRGHALTKLDASGKEAWTFEFPGGAIAQTGPRVLSPSGDTLVRAGDSLFSLSPEGQLHWSRPVFP